MTPAIDPHRRFQRQIALQVGAGAVLLLLASWWAISAKSPVKSGVFTLPVATAQAAQAVTAITPASWNVSLWRPFSDEASAAPASPATALKLYSILQQGDGLIAAISIGDNAELAYVKAGDTCRGYTVVRVDADGVVLRLNGQEQRLGLGP